MPEGEEDLSWPWIKEALPPIQLTKVLPIMAFYDPPLRCFTMQDIFELSMILATHSQCNLASLDVFEDDIPEVPNKLSADNSLPFTGSWKVTKRPGSYLIPGEGARRGIQLPWPGKRCMQYRYLNQYGYLKWSKLIFKSLIKMQYRYLNLRLRCVRFHL